MRIRKITRSGFNKTNEKYNFNREDAYKTLETVNFWINSCDTKASILLSFLGVALTIYFTSDFFDRTVTIISTFFNDKSCLLIFVFFISLFLIILGAVSLLGILIPKIILTRQKKARHIVIESASLMFYGHISQMSFDEYLKKVKPLIDGNDPILDDLLFQIHSASVICSKKTALIRSGVSILFMGLTMFCFLIFYGKFCY